MLFSNRLCIGLTHTIHTLSVVSSTGSPRASSEKLGLDWLGRLKLPSGLYSFQRFTPAIAFQQHTLHLWQHKGKQSQDAAKRNAG